MAKKKKISVIERLGLLFGFVGLFADFAALVSFYYGFANIEQFTPSGISTETATSFFKWFSGLTIIYSWFISSWYFVRRTFVLRYEKPTSYKNPLSSRSVRTIFGIGLFLVPIFIYWSIVNINFSPQSTDVYVRTDIQATSTEEISVTATPMIQSNQVVKPTSTPRIIPTMSPEEAQRQVASFSMVMYYTIAFPFMIFLFGSIIYASINSLMPIVHVELLDDYE